MRCGVASQGVVAPDAIEAADAAAAGAGACPASKFIRGSCGAGATPAAPPAGAGAPPADCARGAAAGWPEPGAPGGRAIRPP
eukprot:243578-Chlamydomonas_euryale.AAC.1